MRQRQHIIVVLVVVTSSAACGSREQRTAGMYLGPVADKDAPLPAVKLPAADYARDLGTVHPVALVTAAENGRWVVACQARADTNGRNGIQVTLGHHGDLGGDDMVPYFFRGGGEGQRIDDLVAASRDDRWLVVLRGGKLVVIDDTTGTEMTIPDADARPDQQGHGRAATFDSSSKRVVYFRPASNAAHVVIRDLERQRERVVVVPNVAPWRIAPESNGHWARLFFIRDDSNRNGKLDWPSIDTNAPLGQACTGPAASYSRYGGPKGDEVLQAWINLETGEVRENKSILAHVGHDEVVKAADKSIRIASKTIVPSSCGAEVLAISENPVRLVVTCASSEKTAPIELYGQSFHAKVDGRGVERGEQRDVRVMDSPYLCSNPETCVSLAAGKPIKLRGSVETIAKNKILTKERDAFFLVDGPTGAPKQLYGLEGYPRARAGDIIAIDTSIIDLAQARVLGDAARAPFAVDLKGRALVPTGGGDREFPSGPLRWSEPTPSKHPVVVDTPEGPWTIDGVAVDEQGKPVKNALVTVSELQLDDADGARSPAQPWIAPGVAAKGMGASVYFSQYPLPTRTDEHGRFAWTPMLATGSAMFPGAHAIMIIADDKRVGAADAIRPGETNIKIVLRPPASLRIVCKNFQPMHPDLSAGGVEILSGHRQLGAACGETLGGLPAGHYLVVSKIRAHEYAGHELDIKAGGASEAVLELRPPGKIEGHVVEYPGDKPVAGIQCDARWPFGTRDIGGDPGATSKQDGSFELRIAHGRAHVWCRGHEFASGMASTSVSSTPTKVTVRVVRLRPSAVDAGAQISAEADGARIIKVTKLAARSGLKRGDLVRAVDDVSLAGLTSEAMTALAFFWPPDAKPRWTVLREGKTMEISATQ